MERGAVISECGKYRYQLWRIWDESKPLVLFIMLNPSKADATKDDSTIKRCIGFAKSWNFGGFYVGNLYAFRATKPKDMKQAKYPEGKDNKKHIAEMAKKCRLVVCAWGNNEGNLDIIDMEDLHYLRLSKNGTPWHPLYLPKDSKPIKHYKP